MADCYLIDVEGILLWLRLPAELHLPILGSLLFMQVLMDDGVVVGDEVETRTEGLDVVTATHLALHQFELVRHTLHLVPESAVVLIIHTRVLHCLDEVAVIQEVEDTVLEGAHLVVGTRLDDKVKVEEVGIVLLLHVLGIHEVVFDGEGGPFAEVADLSLLDDNKVIVIIHLLNDFVGVTHPHLDVLGQTIEGLADEGLEELDMFEDLLIGLLQILLLQLHRQVADELLLLLTVEPLPQLRIFLNVIVHLPRQILVEFVLLGQLLEDLRPLALLCILATDVLDEGADAVDVVGKDEAAEGLDEDETHRLLVVRSHNVSEADSQHHGTCPVV